MPVRPANILRLVLALMMVLYVPVCLCGGAGLDEHQLQSAVDLRHAHDDGVDDDADHAQPEHPGCPGHKHKGKPCACPETVATFVKVDHFAAGAIWLAALPDHPVWMAFASPDAPIGEIRSVAAAVPRPLTSLLRQHCALIV